ncbi:MAG TPA: hypothetical protein VFK03_03065 [Candidatus Saccharimonadales bacterium]|nr:hypothetical protein [Candidatus Saccharimonadales bacterium]
MSQLINQPIIISAVYFSGDMAAYPKRIEWDGQSIRLIDGIRCLIGQGGQLIELFDMTDGRNRYRLRQIGRRWTLLTLN